MRTAVAPCAALALFASAILSVPAHAGQTSAAAGQDKAEVALAVVDKLQIDVQQREVIKHLAPLFADQVLSMPASEMPPAFSQVLAQPGGKTRLVTMLGEDFTKEYLAHLPQFKRSLAKVYTDRMSLADLRSVNAFLDTPAGRNWLSVSAATSQAGADAGRDIGRDAGAAAVVHVLDRLSAEGNSQ